MHKNYSLGKLLSFVREKSNMTQSQLAQKLNVKPIKISRMETETILPELKEIEDCFDAIGNNLANSAKLYLKQDWQEIDKPPFGHPSIESLYLADKALNKIRDLKKTTDPNSIFYSQLEMHDKTLRDLSSFLFSTEHNIAFIGRVGVGKTTAICGVSELKIDGKPVLDAHGGRTTVCEVQIQKGLGYGIVIEPESEDEIFKHVGDFSDYLLAITNEDNRDRTNISNREDFTINKEIERCLRNMSGLTVKRIKEGENYRTEDKAREFANEVKVRDDLILEIMLKLNLDTRKQTEIWFPENISEEPLKWLSKNFSLINNGRNPLFSLPKKINVNIPLPILSHDLLDLKMIDTKGVDQTVKRADLDYYMNDFRTLKIICTGFPDAPDAVSKALIDRCFESGITKDKLLIESCLLILSRNDEAESVNDYSGQPVGDIKEGYLIKKEEAETALLPYELNRMPIYIFDERKDNISELKKFFINRLILLRKVYENRITEVDKTIDKIIENIANAQSKAAFEDIFKELKAWIKRQETLSQEQLAFQDNLLEAIDETHASSVRASANRRGHWYNLDYYHQIGFGVRSECVKIVLPLLDDIKSIIHNKIGREDLAPAHKFLEELIYFIDSEADQLYKEAQLIGQTIYKDPLESNGQFWNDLQSEWGRGPGYKGRIKNKTEGWFDLSYRKKEYELLMRYLSEKIKELIKKIEGLTEGENQS